MVLKEEGGGRYESRVKKEQGGRGIWKKGKGIGRKARQVGRK